MSGNQPKTSQGILPNRIIIGMVDADAWHVNGTFSKDPFDFKNYDITTTGLTAKGTGSSLSPFSTWRICSREQKKK